MRTGLLAIRAWYKYIPTALTLGNSLCGFTAILCCLQIYAPTQGEEVRQLLGFLHMREPEPGPEPGPGPSVLDNPDPGSTCTMITIEPLNYLTMCFGAGIGYFILGGYLSIYCCKKCNHWY